MQKDDVEEVQRLCSTRNVDPRGTAFPNPRDAAVEACADGSYRVLRWLTEQGHAVDPEALDKCLSGAMLHPLGSRSDEAVEALIAAGASGHLALCEAVADGINMHVLRRLNVGYDLHTYLKGQTEYESRRAHPAVAQLIAHGAKIEEGNSSALVAAALTLNVPAVEALLAAGADASGSYCISESLKNQVLRLGEGKGLPKDLALSAAEAAVLGGFWHKWEYKGDPGGVRRDRQIERAGIPPVGDKDAALAILRALHPDTVCPDPPGPSSLFVLAARRLESAELTQLPESVRHDAEAARATRPLATQLENALVHAARRADEGACRWLLSRLYGDGRWGVVPTSGACSALFRVLEHPRLLRLLYPHATRNTASGVHDALCKAASSGQHEALAVLLELGAPVEAPRFTSTSGPSTSALFEAAKALDAEAARLLIAAGARASTKCKQHDLCGPGEAAIWEIMGNAVGNTPRTPAEEAALRAFDSSSMWRGVRPSGATDEDMVALVRLLVDAEDPTAATPTSEHADSAASNIIASGSASVPDADAPYLPRVLLDSGPDAWRAAHAELAPHRVAKRKRYYDLSEAARRDGLEVLNRRKAKPMLGRIWGSRPVEAEAEVMGHAQTINWVEKRVVGNHRKECETCRELPTTLYYLDVMQHWSTSTKLCEGCMGRKLADEVGTDEAAVAAELAQLRASQPGQLHASEWALEFVGGRRGW